MDKERTSLSLQFDWAGGFFPLLIGTKSGVCSGVQVQNGGQIINRTDEKDGSSASPGNRCPDMATADSDRDRGATERWNNQTATFPCSVVLLHFFFFFSLCRVLKQSRAHRCRFTLCFFHASRVVVMKAAFVDKLQLLSSYFDALF